MPHGPTPVTGVALTPNKRLAIAAGENSQVRIWDLTTSPVVLIDSFWAAGGQPITCLAATEFSTRVLVGCANGTAWLYQSTGTSATNWTLVTSCTHELGYPVNAVDISPDERMFISGAWDQKVKRWVLDTGQILTTYNHASPVFSVAYAPGGTRILSGAFDGSVKMWNVAVGSSELISYAAHSGVVSGVAFAPDPLFSWGNSLPDIVDFYRTQRNRGFFSTEFGLTQPNTRKRLINDCYHNYLWLTFATGSVGGPIPAACPGFTVKDQAGNTIVQNWYDLSGVEYLNPRDPYSSVPLNSYTDEILDSLLSLSRFTSLVRWENVGGDWRSVRMDPDIDVKLVTAADARVSENDWLVTAASDGNMMVGWIARRFDYPDLKSGEAVTTTSVPYVRISGMDSGAHHLVWFDDHKGTVIGERHFNGTTTKTLVPYTETSGFGKSVAFLIQPEGYTPARNFERLPNELIGQIEISTTTQGVEITFNEETPSVPAGSYVCSLMTRPLVNLSDGYTVQWSFNGGSWQTGLTKTYVFTGAGSYKKVAVRAYKNGKRVCGDIVRVKVKE